MVGAFIVAALLLVIAAAWLIRLIVTYRCVRIMQEKTKVRVKYYCMHDHPSCTNVPFFGLAYVDGYGERRYVPEIDRMAYGVAIYNRELSHHEMSTYGLIHEPVE